MLTGLTIAALADNPEADSAYFHPAASLYIQGNAGDASNLVARGLAEFPNDGKLKRLKELLEKQQDQEQQDQQNQEQEQDSQDQQQDDQQQDQPDQPEQQQQPEPQRAEQMSQDEAEQLLDAMKQEEKNKRLELHPVMGRPVKVDKDW